MNLWEKIKSAFSGGVETISDKTVEWSSLAKLRWEHRNIQKSIEKKLNQLGGKVYQLRVEKLESQLMEQTKEIVDSLNSLEEQLHQKEQEIQDIVEKGVDKEHLKEFKKDLELGDGKIEQVAIKENTKIVGKMLMDVKFPKNVLIGAIVRNEQVVIPDGKTIFQIGDKVTLLGEKDDVEQAMQILEKS